MFGVGDRPPNLLLFSIQIQAEQRAMQLMSSKQLESAELISAQRELTELQAHLKSQIKISQLQSEKVLYTGQ